MGGFWKKLALGFAAVGKGFAKGAVWASQHPEVLQAVSGIATVAGAPAAGAIIGEAAQIDASLQKK